MRNRLIHGLISLLILNIFASPLFSIVLLDNDQALDQMFSQNSTVITKQIQFSDEEIQILKNRLGGSLDHYTSDDTVHPEKKEYTFYIGVIDQDTTGIAVIEEQPGKWGPVQFIIMIDARSFQVRNLAVMAYKERRGRPIARKNFLKQFIGKDSENEFRLRRDVRGISGATVSSDCACFAVKKVIALVELIIGK